jgi:transposase
VPESVKDLLRLSRGALETFEAPQRQILDRLHRDPLLAKRVKLLRSISGVGEVTALMWALEICDPQRFPSIGNAVSCCGLCSALLSSADKAKRRPNSKQRNAHLQTGLMAASKLAPGWNRQLAEVYERERKGGDCNQAALAVAWKLVACLLAVDKSGKRLEIRTPTGSPRAGRRVA